MKRIFLFLCTILLVASFSKAAYADCDSISDNEEWNDNLENVAAYYDHGDYEESLQIGLKMLSICDMSPTLNYYIAVDYQALGDNNKALEYILKSSDSTKHMATTKANEAGINRKKKELEMIVKGESTDFYKAMREMQREYTVLMWSGAGTAMLGILFTAVGAGLVATDGNNTNTETTSNTPYNTYTHIAGYGMLGAGFTLIVTGTVLAGVYGYKYNHFRMGDNRLLSFYLTPGSAGLTLSF